MEGMCWWKLSFRLGLMLMSRFFGGCCRPLNLLSRRICTESVSSVGKLAFSIISRSSFSIPLLAGAQVPLVGIHRLDGRSVSCNGGLMSLLLKTEYLIRLYREIGAIFESADKRDDHSPKLKNYGTRRLTHLKTMF